MQGESWSWNQAMTSSWLISLLGRWVKKFGINIFFTLSKKKKQFYIRWKKLRQIIVNSKKKFYLNHYNFVTACGKCCPCIKSCDWHCNFIHLPKDSNNIFYCYVPQCLLGNSTNTQWDIKHTRAAFSLPWTQALLPFVTPCYPCYPCYPWLPFVTLVTPWYPVLPLLPLFTLVTPCYPCYSCYPLLPLVTLVTLATLVTLFTPG